MPPIHKNVVITFDRNSFYYRSVCSFRIPAPCSTQLFVCESPTVPLIMPRWAWHGSINTVAMSAMFDHRSCSEICVFDSRTPEIRPTTNGVVARLRMTVPTSWWLDITNIINPTRWNINVPSGPTEDQNSSGRLLPISHRDKCDHHCAALSELNAYSAVCAQNNVVARTQSTTNFRYRLGNDSLVSKVLVNRRSQLKTFNSYLRSVYYYSVFSS